MRKRSMKMRRRKKRVEKTYLNIREISTMLKDFKPRFKAVMKLGTSGSHL
jgi:hypothetical protein